MKPSKHTKGDWMPRLSHSGERIHITGEGARILAVLPSRDIEVQANACLMASAADMLAVLIRWQAYMEDNYLPSVGDLCSETNAIVNRGVGQTVLASWREALPDLVKRVDPLAGIAPEVRRHIWQPELSHQTVKAERCRARVFDDYAWHQCGRKGTRELGGVKFCTQHYRVVVADIGREKKAAAK